MTKAIELIRTAEKHPSVQDTLFRCFATADCRLPERAFLLWDGCVRQSAKYDWPVGFKEKWDACPYRGLLAAQGNGPPRTAFTVSGGKYERGHELAHLYDRPTLRHHNLREGRHFTQSANLICTPPYLHEETERDEYLLWILRGLPFLSLRYDPLGAFSQAQPNPYGFLGSRICEVFWP